MSYRQTHFNLTAERKYSCCATVLPTSQHQNTKDKKPLVCVTLTKGTPMVTCPLIRTEQSAMSSHLWLYQHLASTKPKIPSLLMPNSKSVTEQDSQCLPWLHRLPLRHQKGNRMFLIFSFKTGFSLNSGAFLHILQLSQCRRYHCLKDKMNCIQYSTKSIRCHFNHL